MANEKRLIDANALKAELKKSAEWHEARRLGLYSAMTHIDEQPTVDAVEVLRCRDCKHWLKDVAGCTDFVGRCEWANYMIGADGYCVYGERKDDDGNGKA